MNEMQQAFEREVSLLNYELRKMDDGQYWCPRTYRAWQIWQAACRWADGAEQVDKSVAIPDKNIFKYSKEQNKC